MCTLIALHRRVPGVPLVVAANRDEFHDRPAEGPKLRETASGPVVAPLDRQGGGTWLGIARGRGGLFVAVTNVSCQSPDPARRSRGLLVLDLLSARDAREAAEKAQGLPLHAYNPFNLLVADAAHAAAFTYEESLRPAPAPDGVFVVGNAPLDAQPPRKVDRLRERVATLAASGRAPDEALEGLLRDHSEGPRGALDAVCVHAGPYGTRSAALLRLGARGLSDPRSSFRFAEGPPCQSETSDLTSLLRDLDHGRPGAHGASERNVS